MRSTLLALAASCALLPAAALAQTTTTTHSTGMSAPATGAGGMSAPATGAGGMSAPATKMAPNASNAGAAATATDNGAGHYSSESAAQSGCSGDTVVWANSTSKALWQSGTKYYGKTKHGFYACQKQALADGFHMHGGHHGTHHHSKSA